ncbi:MAG: T9SS type A sorting domain-containing protein [Candidatus Cloacimonas sp.]|jgi:hypothetical protein|nr:T9SS type A sorting domain-containing protein [Candidatus Cloacimonas sp.]HQO17858.1 T9SS type A sorting domain-containing protein [Candidatus Cloacimonas sp.]
MLLIFTLIITIFMLMICGCNPNTALEENSTWLGEANPNPMQVGETTTIQYGISDGDTGYLFIHNSLGQPVKIIILIEGSNSLNWNGRDDEGRLCASGVYYYTLLTNFLFQTKKLVICM